jgi:hypothetical protein
MVRLYIGHQKELGLSILDAQDYNIDAVHLDDIQG